MPEGAHPVPAAWPTRLDPRRLPESTALGLLIYLGLLVWRAPEIVLAGRFWAEEALFFQQARHTDLFTALAAAPLGYLNLPANLAAWLASRVPLELAPRVTVSVALLVQMLPALLLLRGGVPGLRAWWQRWLALLLLLVVPPSQEVWLNSVNAQFHLAIAAALVLVAPAGRGVGAVGRRLVLLLAGLGGVPALFLTPLFWWRTHVEGSGERLGQALVLTLCLLCQGALVIQLLMAGVRGGEIYWTAFPLVVLAKQVMLPLLGSGLTDGWVDALIPLLTMPPTRHWLAPLLWSLLTAFWLLALSATWRSGARGARYLLLASMVMLVLGFWGGADLHRPAVALGHARALFAGRYYYAPNVLVALALLNLAVEGRGGWQRGVVSTILAWVLVVGGLDYVHSRARHGFFFDGPSWSLEVVRHRIQGIDTLAIWPVPWYVRVADPGNVHGAP